MASGWDLLVGYFGSVSVEVLLPAAVSAVVATGLGFSFGLLSADRKRRHSEKGEAYKRIVGGLYRCRTIIRASRPALTEMDTSVRMLDTVLNTVRERFGEKAEMDRLDEKARTELAKLLNLQTDRADTAAKLAATVIGVDMQPVGLTDLFAGIIREWLGAEQECVAALGQAGLFGAPPLIKRSASSLLDDLRKTLFATAPERPDLASLDFDARIENITALMEADLSRTLRPLSWFQDRVGEAPSAG